MKSKRKSVVVTLLVVGVALLWSLQAGAYIFFAGDNNCSQCHTEWPGTSHDFHSASFNCTLCHVDEGVVQNNTCVACHDFTEMMVLHGPFIDGGGFQCGYCHEGVSAEERSWSDVKNQFN